MQHLQPNTTLQGGKYRIERVLGQGGFGNTYVGINTVFNERIAIKEFFMQGINDRDDATGSITISIERNKQQFQEQLEKFKKEALRIRKLDNPHIVKVHDLFEENGTAYYVMDYVDGENLAERLKRTGKPMTEQEALKILPQILDALKSVHDAGIWHLDLKPANIMLDKAGNVRLIDFGASKQMDAQKGGATTGTAISYTNGYAPREQMEQNYDKFGPWTDIYALGATLYNLLTNKRPPLPSDIDDDVSEDKHLALPFRSDISKEMHDVILWMMNSNRKCRPGNVEVISNRVSSICIGDSLFDNQEEHEDLTKTDEKTLIDTFGGEEAIVESLMKQEQEDDIEEYESKYDNTWPLYAKITYGIIALFFITIIISSISAIKYDLEVGTAIPELRAEKQIKNLIATIVILFYGTYLVYNKKTNLIYVTCMILGVFVMNIIRGLIYSEVLDLFAFSTALLFMVPFIVMGLYLLKSKKMAVLFPVENRNIKVIDFIIIICLIVVSFI